MTTIALVPVGTVPDDLLAWLARELPRRLDAPVDVGEGTSVPREAYDTRRRQLRGDDLLDALRALSCPGCDRVVGLVDLDCHAGGLNFIFGQAAAGGREALVALPRLRPSFYGLPEDPPLFRARVVKEIVHELGHTWSLPHCPDPRCVMHFSNTLQDTDMKSAEYCPTCLARLTPRRGKPQIRPRSKESA